MEDFVVYFHLSIDFFGNIIFFLYFCNLNTTVNCCLDKLTSLWCSLSQMDSLKTSESEIKHICFYYYKSLGKSVIY